jgi:hypothetical protein
MLLDKDRVLQIVTSRDRVGHLVTRAYVGSLRGGMIAHALYSDFAETVARTELRATDGNVRRQHGGVLSSAVQLRSRAEQFYAAVDADEGGLGESAAADAPASETNGPVASQAAHQ